MRTRLFTVLAGCVLYLCHGHAAETPDTAQLLKRIAHAPGHPRLFWTARDIDSVREKIQKDPLLQEAWESVVLTADRALLEPPVMYRKEGRRLLGRSREALGRMMHLGMACRLTGDAKYLARARAEMEAMAAMPDWNPSHFLDTAEMTLAMAVGYDWLYDQLSPELRATARKAIEEKGLGPYLKPEARQSWEHGGNNWNQVCHAGMLAGALALLEDNPQRAAEVVRRTISGLPYVMKVYDPDGNYPEGPGYWNYGTTFNVIAISMMDSALGSDFGVSTSPGFLKAGEFPLQTMGPTRRPFNFSDCGTGAAFNPAMVWFAAQTGQPELMWFERELMRSEMAKVRQTKGKASVDRVFPLVLLWARPGQQRQAPAQLSWLAHGENPLAIFRTSWSDPDAVFLAIKAGTPAASHAHMDIGSFVLDALGERWSLDLGSQDYNKLEQRGITLWNNRQGSQRWSIFRYHNRAHSTLLVNDAEQVVASKAAIVDFSGDPKDMHAVVDLSATYAGQLSKATRRFSLSPARVVTVEDDISAGTAPANVRWGMVTKARIEPDGANSAWLEQGGKRLKLRVLSPAKVEIKAWPANPPPHDYDEPNPGVSIVGFEVPLAAGQSEVLKVSFEPESK